MMRVACQRSPTAISNVGTLRSGYVSPAVLSSPTICSVSHRLYSQSAPGSHPEAAPTAVKIYSGSLSSRLWRVKLFSLSTSVLGICAQPVLIEKGAQMAGTAGVIALCSVAGFFAFVTPVLLHTVVKKYVTEMEHNPATDEYSATTISLFMRKQKVSS